MGADAPMVKNGRANATWGLSSDGCSCCNSKTQRRHAIKSSKAKEKAAWKRGEGAR